MNDPYSPKESAAKRARLVIVATGGTIAGAAKAATQTTGYRAGALPVERLLEAAPGLERLAELETDAVCALDSKDMSTAVWLTLSRRIAAHLSRDDVDGVVVTHGTDTLEETAYWLHLTVPSDKPIVLTAAMRPATAISADGPLNLYDAVCVAASTKSRGKGVMFVFAQKIFSAREVTKISTYSVEAFTAGEAGVLGWVQDGQVSFQRSQIRRHTADSRFAPIGDLAQAADIPDVEVLASHAGATGRATRALVESGVSGIVVMGTGNGSIHADLQAALSEAVRHGVVVVRSSRLDVPRVTPEGGAPDEALGFVCASSVNAFKARVLLMLTLAQGVRDVATIRRIFDEY